MTYMGGSVAALATDRNTWQGRANQAWGPSDVWNSGTSWEAMYGTANSSAATWESRADQAWGASRDWSVGESWEAAYNRVLPAPLTTQDNTNIVNGSVGQTPTVLASFNATRTGTYHLSGWAQTLGSNGTNQWRLDIYVNGAAVVNGWSQDIDAGSEHQRAAQYRGTVSAGQSMQLVSVLQGGTASTINVATGAFFTTFVPTQSNPH